MENQRSSIKRLCLSSICELSDKENKGKKSSHDERQKERYDRKSFADKRLNVSSHDCHSNRSHINLLRKEV